MRIHKIWAAPLALVALMCLSACIAGKKPPETETPSAPKDLGTAARKDFLAKNTVLTGLDIMEREKFARLKGRKVGLIANQTAINRQGRHLLDLVIQYPEVQLVALFSPEYGFRGTADEKISSGREESTGLPLYSLYGDTMRPTEAMLDGIDTLVFDMQDVGARYCTYLATLGMCMEEASKRGIRFIVLDRPNPLGGFWFDGPVQDFDLIGNFTSFLPMPIFHGMTIGEVAVLFNTHYGIGANLEVVRMEGWYRDMWFDETGLPWVNPSPNMRSLDEEILYLMVGQTENPRTGLSVGRGTDRPYEYVGAPWVDGQALANELKKREIAGLGIMPIKFKPYDRDITGARFPNYPHINKECGGLRLSVSNRWAFSPVEAGIQLISALYALYPDAYNPDHNRGSIGAQWVVDAIRAKEDPARIAARWRESKEFKEFAAAREKVLYYAYSTR